MSAPGWICLPRYSPRFARKRREVILHPCKALLARPILVETDIVIIKGGKDLASEF